MDRRPFLVVAGLGDFAREIERAQVFPQIVTAESVSSLLEAFTRPDLAKRKPDDVVLVFADNLHEDHQLPLVEVLRRLTGAGYHVVIVSVTARGADLARQFPKAGLLPMPLRINSLLYAVNAFGYTIDPVNETATDSPAETRAHNPTSSQGWAPGAAPTQPGPPATPHPSGAAAGPAGGGWAPAPTQTAQPAPTPQPAASPRPAPTPGNSGNNATPGPAGGGWAPAPGAPRPAGSPVSAPPPTGAPVRPVDTRPGPGRDTPPSGRPVLFPQGGTAGREPQRGADVDNGWSQAPTGGAPWAPVERHGAYPSAPAGAPRRGYVITIAVSKGGTGKSSLTLNLAAFLGMRLRMLGKTVCVIDANFQQADSGKYLDQYTPNINTIANDPRLLTRERILEGLVHRPEYNLSVLLGPATPDEGNPWNINEDLYVEILDLLREHYDYILIDTPVAEKYHGIFQKFALPKADYLIVPVAPSFQTLHNAFNWLNSAVVQPRHAGGAGVDPSKIGIVLNRAEEGIGCTEDDVRQTMARWEFLGSIPERKEWKLANNRHELIAPKAYAELNQAFATVLHRATGEAVLLSNIEASERPRGVKGLLGKLSRGRQ